MTESATQMRHFLKIIASNAFVRGNRPGFPSKGRKVHEISLGGCSPVLLETQMLNRRTFIASAAALATAPVTARADGHWPLATLPPELAPRVVTLNMALPAGQIHVVPDDYSLYWTLPGSRAIRYFVGVGKDALYEPGIYVIRAKKEWPSWRPTDEMMERNEAYREWEDGMEGGPENPLGARALYLFDGPRDTFLRIHGTHLPNTIGKDVSNGCARLVNRQIVDLYNRVPKGTTVYMYEKDILPPVTAQDAQA